MDPQLYCEEKTCDFCGARIEVSAVEFAGEPQPHIWLCPQCGKNHEMVTTGPLHLRVLAPRSDGRNSHYEQTMF